MADQVANIRIRGAVRRALTLLPLALTLVGAWFSVRWYVGNTIADNLNPADHAMESARLASELAPGDPLTHWSLAEIEQSNLPVDQVNKSIKEYEQAASLSPNDYRFWLALGRALEQAGAAERAEQAMTRAVELAPAYAYPRWYLGNLQLRRGREAEAFAQLRRASVADPQLQGQVFNLVWELYGNDPAALDKAIGATSAARADFAKYLIDRQQIDGGVRIWSALTAPEKQEHRAIGELLTKSLVDAKRFRQAQQVWNEVAPAEGLKGKPGQVFDGGFEQKTDSASLGPFVWQVKSTQQAQAGVDSSRAHGGSRSLRLLFKAPAKAEVSVSQLVVVDPDTQYDLECFLKTSGLESAGTPIIEVLATDGAKLGNSEPALAGNNDWQRISIAFKTGARAEAIVIRITRSSCGELALCPIFGTVWYDDFDLKRRA